MICSRHAAVLLRAGLLLLPLAGSLELVGRGCDVARRLVLLGIPDAELLKQDDATVVRVHLVKLLLGLRLVDRHAELVRTGHELGKVEAAVVVSVDLLEGLKQLVEVEQVRKQLRKLLGLDPGVAVTAILERGLLVRPHHRRLVVEERVALDHQLVDLGQADQLVVVKVHGVPHLVELGVVCQHRHELDLQPIEQVRVEVRNTVDARPVEIRDIFLGRSSRSGRGLLDCDMLSEPFLDRSSCIVFLFGCTVFPELCLDHAGSRILLAGCNGANWRHRPISEIFGSTRCFVASLLDLLDPALPSFHRVGASVGRARSHREEQLGQGKGNILGLELAVHVLRVIVELGIKLIFRQHIRTTPARAHHRELRADALEGLQRARLRVQAVGLGQQLQAHGMDVYRQHVIARDHVACKRHYGGIANAILGDERTKLLGHLGLEVVRGHIVQGDLESGMEAEPDVEVGILLALLQEANQTLGVGHVCQPLLGHGGQRRAIYILLAVPRDFTMLIRRLILIFLLLEGFWAAGPRVVKSKVADQNAVHLAFVRVKGPPHHRRVELLLRFDGVLADHSFAEPAVRHVKDGHHPRGVKLHQEEYPELALVHCDRFFPVLEMMMVAVLQRRFGGGAPAHERIEVAEHFCDVCRPFEDLHLAIVGGVDVLLDGPPAFTKLGRVLEQRG